MNNGQSQTALITGATSGIGLELARLFAKDGYNLVLVARTEHDLQECARQLQQEGAGQITVIPKDLFLPQAAQELYEEVRAQGITVDILVNDAGQGEFGPFVDIDLQRHINIIQLNVTSLTVLTQLFAKDMVTRGSGKILQLASIVSKMPSPLQAVYGATKAYVYSLTESLINELKDTGVSMTALLPGATDTDFFRKADGENTVVYQDTKLSDPSDVAKDGYEALMDGDSRVISGLKNKVQGMMSNIMPDQMVAENVRKQNEEKTNVDQF
jgi:short-subunit dehydrogenase